MCVCVLLRCLSSLFLRAVCQIVRRGDDGEDGEDGDDGEDGEELAPRRKTWKTRKRDVKLELLKRQFVSTIV